MNTNPQAIIISYNTHNEAICASAARISTTPGNAEEIFQKAQGNAKNRNLIEKVLSSGHKSLLEHAVFTIAFRNVSAYVEQFFIECRLASFTVKSRRYVDFSQSGYYIPPELTGNDRHLYENYMDHLFHAYHTLLESGVPREDARFILPYSFHSNFYCTLNARELGHVICAIQYGRGRNIPELKQIAAQITEQIKTLFPCLLPEFEKPDTLQDVSDSPQEPVFSPSPVFLSQAEIGSVELIHAPVDPLSLLNIAWKISHPDCAGLPEMSTFCKGERLRELEQLSYTFTISNISLSGITHIVRHRMQSVIIPSIQTIDHSRFLIPPTVERDSALLAQYRHILEKTCRLLNQMEDNRTLKAYHYYFALSGNVMNSMTTMNARELLHFIRLRTCNRAQWEIRNMTVNMLTQLREHFPELFNHFGPSCFHSGFCPEGKLTCGQMASVIAGFKNDRENPNGSEH